MQWGTRYICHSLEKLTSKRKEQPPYLVGTEKKFKKKKAAIEKRVARRAHLSGIVRKGLFDEVTFKLTTK